MSQPDAESELNKEIYECGELERDLAQLADWSPRGGLLYRFWKWGERIVRENREAAIEDRTALQERGK
mgnify:CR=1 FL=1